VDGDAHESKREVKQAVQASYALRARRLGVPLSVRARAGRAVLPPACKHCIAGTLGSAERAPLPQLGSFVSRDDL
jgi:hypothetical protein